MTDYIVFKKAFQSAGYDIEDDAYGDYALITIKGLQISFEFENEKLLFINNERYEGY